MAFKYKLKFQKNIISQNKKKKMIKSLMFLLLIGVISSTVIFPQIPQIQIPTPTQNYTFGGYTFPINFPFQINPYPANPITTNPYPVNPAQPAPVIQKPIYPYPGVPTQPVSVNPSPAPAAPARVEFKPTQAGVYLDSHSKKCYKQQIDLFGGQNQLSFDFKIHSSTELKTSALIVSLDNTQILKVLPSESGKNIKVALPQLAKGPHVIQFCPSGGLNEISHVIQVSNILINEKVCSREWTKNLLVNGGFDQKCDPYKSLTPCPPPPTNGQKQFHYGWTAIGDIKTIPAYTINLNKGFKDNVISFQGNGRRCIQQNLNLKPGRFILSYNISNYFTFPQSRQNKFEALINGKVVKSSSFNDNLVHKQTVQFELTSVPGQSEILFCSNYNVNFIAYYSDNYELIYLDECSKVQSVKYGPFPTGIVNASNQIAQIKAPGIYINSNSDCRQKSFNLESGQIQISFEFKYVEGTPLTSSAFVVSFDNKNVQIISSNQAGRRVSFKISNVVNGIHTIGLCTYPDTDEQSYKILVSNFLIEQPNHQQYWSA